MVVGFVGFTLATKLFASFKSVIDTQHGMEQVASLAGAQICCTILPASANCTYMQEQS
jgi:uncharacterized membrane protein YeaQ/YmgE (transglycosylase-associated protein family)